MPRPRFAKLAVEKQQRILRAAAQAFAAHGFDGASLNRIIAEAGISKGAVYYYFDDKADLLITVLADLWQRLLPSEQLDPSTLTAETFWPAIHSWMVGVLETVIHDEVTIGIGKLFYRLPREQLAGTSLEAELHAAHGLLESLVARGQQLGVVRSDLPRGLLLAVVAGAAESSDRWMSEHWEELEPDEAFAASIALTELLEGLAAPRDLRAGDARPAARLGPKDGEDATRTHGTQTDTDRR